VEIQRVEHDIDSLRAELAEMRAEVARLQACPPPAPSDTRVSRRRLITGLAGLGVASAAGLATAAPAAADDGDPLLLGLDNLAAGTTKLTGENLNSEPALSVVMDGSGLAADFYGGVYSYGIHGVHGEGFVGLLGRSDEGAGVAAEGVDNAAGVNVVSEHGPAVLIATTDGPHIVFDPVGGVGPTNGPVPAAAGALTVDSNLDLWLCTAAGPPAVWTQLLRDDTAHGRTVPISPIRAIDTRAPGGRPAGSPAVPGQKAGPLKGGTSLTLDLADIGPIPATATGVIGNLAVVTPSFSGYLAARPSGTPAITTSLNFPGGVAALANAFTSQLGPAGLTITGSGTSANTYHLVVDITAYIT
jgi:hypothetical protein